MQKVSEEKKVLLSHVSQIVENLIQDNSLYPGVWTNLDSTSN